MTIAGRRAEIRAALLFLAPGLSAIGIFFLLPVLAVLLLSFTDFDLYALADSDNARFMGLRNYGSLLQSDVFWIALRNTLVFAFIGGPLTVAVSLAAALLVNARLVRFKGFFRTAFFAPFVTTLVAVSVVWKYLYHPRFGLLNSALGLVGIDPIDWLGDPRWALPALILLAIWKNFGYNMVLFLGGLQSIPPQLYEAARIDGAGLWREFIHVTLPMLAPTSLFVGVITAIGYFQIFAEPYVMTRGGGPVNATLTVVLFMYKEGFRWWNMGFAAAVAFVLFLIILVATRVQIRLQKGAAE